MMNDLNHLDEITLTDYLDDALNPDQRTEVERHLAQCGDCTFQVAEFRALFTTLQDTPSLTLEQDLAPVVLTAIQPTPAPYYQVQELRRILLGEITLVVVLGMAVWQWLSPRFIEAQQAMQRWWASLDVTLVWVQFQQMWSTAIAPIYQIQLPTFRDVTGIAPLSWTTVVVVFLVAAVVWIAGNRWLLVPTRTNSPS
jgi:anti-sigma factor RsiW